MPNRWGSGRRCLVAGAGDSLAVVSAALASAGFTSTHAPGEPEALAHLETGPFAAGFASQELGAMALASAVPRQRAASGRKRDGQGADRPRAACAGAAPLQPLRSGELRDPRPRHPGKRAVRPRERRIYRRQRTQERAVRARRRRHAVPRRDRGDGPFNAGEAAAGPRAQRIPPRGWDHQGEGRLQRDRGHPPQPGKGDPHGEIPRGPVLPARSEEHTSELQSLAYLVCRLLLEKKKQEQYPAITI